MISAFIDSQWRLISALLLSVVAVLAIRRLASRGGSSLRLRSFNNGGAVTASQLQKQERDPSTNGSTLAAAASPSSYAGVEPKASPREREPGGT